MSLAVSISIVIAVGGALLAVTLSNILHAVFGLAVSLLGVAGLFFCLGSPFVAAMEVLVYVGGISVAMVFAVMLSYSIGGRDRPREERQRRVVAAVPTLFFFSVLFWIISTADLSGVPVDPADPAWSVQAIGRALLTHYNLVFEVLSLVLLVAIMGAITISKREPDDKGPEEAA